MSKCECVCSIYPLGAIELEEDIARLRAEVERPTSRLEHLNDVASDLKRWWLEPQRESDEALAQVAVLVQALENVLYAQLRGHLNPTDDGKKVLNTIRPLQSQTTREARVRALLDRLQRLQHIKDSLEPLQDVLKDHPLRGEGDSLADTAIKVVQQLQRAEAVVNSKWEHRCSDGVGGCTAVSAEALAAWEKNQP